MKKTIILILSFTIVFSISDFGYANGNDGLRYYYKGSSASYKYQGTDGVYKDSNNEWATFTIHQFFNHTAAAGRILSP